MIFRIEWKRETLQQFADEWDKLDQRGQKTVMDALDTLDHFLQQGPLLVGESRGSYFDRLLFHPPIAVAYEVNVRLRLVTIHSAKLLRLK